MAITEIFTEKKVVKPSAKAVKPSAVEETILDVRIPRQKFDNWCWAAVADGIAQAYGEPARQQCQIVSEVLGEPSCCSDDAVVSVCNVPHDMAPALGSHHETTFIDPDHRRFNFIRKEIRAGRPVVVRIDWRTPGAGHVVVIAGYRKKGSIIDLHIWDPRTGERSQVRFGHFVSAYQQRGFWDHSYTTRGNLQARVIEL